MTTVRLPAPVAEVVARLTTMPGTVAVALGGSQALGTADAGSDWDLGLYYRGSIDLESLATFGPVFPAGSWGRLMNGGAWLHVGGLKVDVMLRDLDVVEHWSAKADRGEFERDALLGYLAGAPTYLLRGELASCTVLHGTLPSGDYPDALARSAPPIWRFCRDFSLEYARMLAGRGDAVGAAGQVAAAALQEGHARRCEQRVWVCNEKRLVSDAGLTHVQARFASLTTDGGAGALSAWVDDVARAIAMGADA